MATRFILMVIILTISSWTRAQTLGEALNATNLAWSTSGSVGAQGWSVQSTSTHDGVSAARSGSVNFDIQTSTVETTVNGPGTLSFWWKNPSANRLSFISGSTTLASITSYPSWEQQTFHLGSGVRTLKWVLSALPAPQDPFRFGYLDEVSFTDGTTAPIIITQPLNQSVPTGMNAMFTVAAGGTPPLAYQWRFDDVNIPGATAASLTITNVQATHLGFFRVIITNEFGSVVSSNASLEFGEITAWGLGQYGQTAVPAGATNIIAIAGGDYHSLALRADGQVLAWGRNQFGQAIVPPSLTNVVAVAGGATHSLALKADGTVAAWGSHEMGETNVPPGLTNVVAVAAGNAHNLVLKSDGTVAAWGWNIFGQTNIPAGLTDVVAVAASHGHSMALKRDGVVVAWGNNDYDRTNLPGYVRNVIAIEAGDDTCVAIRSDRTIVTWGRFGLVSMPTVATNIVAVETDYAHSLALRADGKVIAWGFSSTGVTNVLLNLSNVVAIAAGRNHNLALIGSGPPRVNALFVNPTRMENQFTVSLLSQSGRVYGLEYKESLTDLEWTVLPLAAGNGGTLVLCDPAAADAQRFYRVRQW